MLFLTVRQHCEILKLGTEYVLDEGELDGPMWTLQHLRYVLEKRVDNLHGISSPTLTIIVLLTSSDVSRALPENAGRSREQACLLRNWHGKRTVPQLIDRKAQIRCKRKQYSSMHKWLWADDDTGRSIWQSWSAPWTSPGALEWALRDFDASDSDVLYSGLVARPEVALFPKLAIPSDTGLNPAVDNEFTQLVKYRMEFGVQLCTQANHASTLHVDGRRDVAEVNTVQ